MLEIYIDIFSYNTMELNKYKRNSHIHMLHKNEFWSICYFSIETGRRIKVPVPDKIYYLPVSVTTAFPLPLLSTHKQWMEREVIFVFK